jgi:hypothetical protein
LFSQFWSNFGGEEAVRGEEESGIAIEKKDHNRKSGIGDGAKKGIMKINQ